MLTMNFPPVFVALLLTTGAVTASPDHLAASVSGGGERLPAAPSDAYRYPETPLPLLPPSSAADMSVLTAASDTWLRVAHEPQADETCEGEWEMTLSHKSWRCIDGVWHQITDEQWTCEAPRHHLHHSHQQRTQDACQVP